MAKSKASAPKRAKAKRAAPKRLDEGAATAELLEQVEFEPEPEPAEETPEDERAFDEALRASILRRAAAARLDPAIFFSFVMREETTRTRVRTLPHQQVLFDFVMAHARCVVRMPVGFSKTYCMAALTLFLLGQDPTARGAVISSTQDQAAKPLGLVRDMIENKGEEYPELKLVFPALAPSDRESDPWTQTKIVVQRPAGIRDPSLTALGVDGALPGSRLSWILVDDILDRKNTATVEGRKKVKSWFSSSVLSRRDIRGSRIVVTNTPWHTDDLTYALEKAGWPTLTMDAEGGIVITNTDWDTDAIRPAYRTQGAVQRLAAHDAEAYGAPEVAVLPNGSRELAANDNARAKATRLERFDLDEVIPLWPERYGVAEIEKLRADYADAMHEFNQLYLCRCRADEDALVKVEWIDECKRRARAAGHYSLVSEYRGPNLTVTGLDLAIGLKRENDSTSFFTFEVIPKLDLLVEGEKLCLRNVRRILDIEVGRWKGRAIVDKAIAKATRFQSFLRVETNAAQDYLRQWLLDVDVSVPVRAHTTGSNKHHRAHGVAGVFVEIENGAWLIPNDLVTHACHPAVQRWIDEVLYYAPPPAHTGDVLLSSWLAREEARYISGGGAPANDGEDEAAGLGVNLLAR